MNYSPPDYLFVMGLGQAAGMLKPQNAFDIGTLHRAG